MPPVVAACKCVSSDNSDLTTHAQISSVIKDIVRRRMKFAAPQFDDFLNLKSSALKWFLFVECEQRHQCSVGQGPRFNCDGRAGLFVKEGASSAEYVECKEVTAAAQTCANGQGFSKLWQKCMWNGVVDSCTQERALTWRRVNPCTV